MVRDFKYVIKRILIGVGIALLLSFIKGNLLMNVNAQVVSYKLYDVNYNLLYENNGTYAFDGDLSPVRYARVIFNDILINNHSYSLSTQFGLTSSVDYAWIYWNGSSGINLNGAYFMTSPTSASTTNQQQVGSSSFYKQTNLMFDFVPSSNVSTDWFLQLDFGSGRNIRFFDLLNYTLIDGGVNTNQDLINQTNNIINNQNINNQNVINNQNNNTQDIINNQNNNTQDIINNQNNNTQDIIDSNKVCKYYDKSNIIEDNTYLKSDGTLGHNNSFGITDYIPLSSSSQLTFTNRNNNYYCYYNVNKTVISCSNDYSNVSFPNDVSFLRFSIFKSDNRPTLNICTNGNQALQDSLLDDSSVSDNELNQFLNDLSPVSTSPVSDLLTLPLTLLQAYLSGFESSCTPYNFGTLYGTPLIFPCINIPQYLGQSLWSLIDALFSIFMIYNIAMMCISIYESFTSLDDAYQLLYSPQHSGHTRVSRNEGEY